MDDYISESTKFIILTQFIGGFPSPLLGHGHDEPGE